MKKRIISTLIFIAILMGFSITAQSQQMTSTSFKITNTSVSGGGAPATSTTFQINSTLGQPTPLAVDVPLMSDSFDLYPGVWYAFTAEQIPNTCPGDLNNDGIVDEEDLALMAADFGRVDCIPAEACQGNIDEDDDVDGTDLFIFLQDFGRTDCLD